MGSIAYMSLFDANNNQIMGSSEVLNRENCIEIKKVDYHVSREVDPLTGKSHSTRRHKPFTILKPIDCSTPDLFQCCTSGKLLSSARIDLYKIDDEGYEINYFTYLLENARVVSVTPMISAM